MRSIVIVEDESDVAPLEIALTALHNIQIVIFKDARLALDFIEGQDGTIAGIVTDIHLPYFNGLELIAALRRQNRYATLPIIVVSGSTDPDMPKRALASGADAYFAKPYSPAEIRQTLSRLFYVTPPSVP